MGRPTFPVPLITRRKKLLAGPAEKLKEFFRQFDANGDGRLSYPEIRNAFKKLGSSAPWWRALVAVLQSDENRDGCISENELDELLDYAVQNGYVVVMPCKQI